MGTNNELSMDQYGFRAGRSTIDAILQLREITTNATRRGRVVVAVSLDIKNAFNSLSREGIISGLRRKGIPSYLMNILHDYLGDRRIIYAQKGELQSRVINRGVPQGSILGPLLWNISYNLVLQTPMPEGVHLLRYSDDTLVVADAQDLAACAEQAERAITRLGGRMGQLGLTLAASKTEAVAFRHRRPPPMDFSIRVGNDAIKIPGAMKYLGIYVDGHWNFRLHFQVLTEKLERTTIMLNRLLPNLSGPRETVRRLYIGIFRSMALYGAPVWIDALQNSKKLRQKLNRLNQRLCVKAARGYRTICGTVAEVFTRSPPLDLMAEAAALRFHAKRNNGMAHARVEENEDLLRRAVMEKRIQRLWMERLRSSRYGRRFISAVLPVFDEWMKRPPDWSVTFGMTQVLTGHGCFGSYLHRIGKEITNRCHHCTIEEADDADHTLIRCPAWTEERLLLCRILRPNQTLDLDCILMQAVRQEEAWSTFRDFCENVMLSKEDAERLRESQRLR